MVLLIVLTRSGHDPCYFAAVLALLTRCRLGVLGAVWAAVVVTGFAILWRYKSTPGADALPPDRWPAGSELERAADRATVVLFAHPHCVCTRASIAELARLLPRIPERPRAYVVFLLPDGAGEDWSDTDLWHSAARIPGVSVVADRGGRERERFRVATSGATLVYDRGGRLLFHGGITQARGHEGESFGQRRILSLLASGEADRASSPVFGCPLDDRLREEASP
jgi:hypothetical protein